MIVQSPAIVMLYTVHVCIVHPGMKFSDTFLCNGLIGSHFIVDVHMMSGSILIINSHAKEGPGEKATSDIHIHVHVKSCILILRVGTFIDKRVKES